MVLLQAQLQCTLNKEGTINSTIIDAICIDGIIFLSKPVEVTQLHELCNLNYKLVLTSII